MQQVTQHMVSHANSKKVGCSKCPATFTNSANLRSHLKAHYGIKDCCCEICGKVSLPSQSEVNANCFVLIYRHFCESMH